MKLQKVDKNQLKNSLSFLQIDKPNVSVDLIQYNYRLFICVIQKFIQSVGKFVKHCEIQKNLL